MTKSRLDWVDTFKFLGIFAIYLGHLASGAGKAYPFVFIYHVPLFFFAAGFFANYTKKVSFCLFVTDKFKRLMLPYFVFTLISLSVTAINSGYTSFQFLSAFENIAYGVRNDPFVGGVWFINCLFIICIIDFVAYSLLKNKYFVFMVSIVAHVITQTLLTNNPLAEPSWFMNIDSALAYWWLMALGRLIFAQLNGGNLFNKKIYSYPMMAFVFTVTLFALLNTQSIFPWLMARYAPGIHLAKAFWIVNGCSVTFIIILANLFIAKWLSNIKKLSEIGRNTLNICGFEIITKTALPAAISLLGLAFTVSSPLAALIYTSVCIWVSHVVTKLISNKIGSVFSIR